MVSRSHSWSRSQRGWLEGDLKGQMEVNWHDQKREDDSRGRETTQRKQLLRSEKD